MCLDSIAPKNTVVTKCRKDPEGLRIGYKIVKRYESGLISPFQQEDIFTGLNNGIHDLQQSHFVKPSTSEYTGNTYPLGYHIYALKKDAICVLKHIKQILRYQNRTYEICKYVIVPIHFDLEDVLAEGFEDFLAPYYPSHNPKPSRSKNQAVVVLKKYILKQNDYLNAILSPIIDERITSNE